MSKITARNRKRSTGECAICGANGRVPNRVTRLAIEQVESEDLYEYTGVIGPSMMTRILNGEDVRKRDADTREDVLT